MDFRLGRFFLEGARLGYLVLIAEHFHGQQSIVGTNQHELVATGRTEAEVAREISADLLIYQELDALKAAVRQGNPKLSEFEASCFDGKYITGDVTADYLSQLARVRDVARGEMDADADAREAVAAGD